MKIFTKKYDSDPNSRGICIINQFLAWNARREKLATNRYICALCYRERLRVCYKTNMFWKTRINVWLPKAFSKWMLTFGCNTGVLEQIERTQLESQPVKRHTYESQTQPIAHRVYTVIEAKFVFFWNTILIFQIVTMSCLPMHETATISTSGWRRMKSFPEGKFSFNTQSTGTESPQQARLAFTFLFVCHWCKHSVESNYYIQASEH